MRLTKEGGLLAEYVRKGYETILTGEKKLSEMLNLDAGEICVGASDMTLQFYLLPYLEAFHDAFPQIKVTVTNAPTPETLKHLQDGKIDFGIISTPVNNKYDFKMTPVRKIQDVFVAGKKFEYLKGGKLSYNLSDRNLNLRQVICSSSLQCATSVLPVSCRISQKNTLKMGNYSY